MKRIHSKLRSIEQ